jgi:hypothetical protein
MQAQPDMEQIDAALDADAELQKSISEMLFDLSAVLRSTATSLDLDAHISQLLPRGEQRLQRVLGSAVLAAQVAPLSTAAKYVERTPAAAASKAPVQSQRKSR